MGLIQNVVDFLESFQPSPEKIKRDMLEFRQELKEPIAGLIPLHGKELELLSLSQVKKQVNKRFGYQVKGGFTSIYHEPMVTYGFKRYRSGKVNYLIYARTKEREYAFRVKDRKATIFLNGSSMGTLVDGEKIYGGRNNRLIGRVKVSQDLHWPVILLDREVAHLNNPNKIQTVNPRAFFFLRELDASEESVLLAFAFYHMITNQKEFLID
jgi:hypothetical protein